VLQDIGVDDPVALAGLGCLRSFAAEEPRRIASFQDRKISPITEAPRPGKKSKRSQARPVELLVA
jgi:hypothetical protein